MFKTAALLVYFVLMLAIPQPAMAANTCSDLFAAENAINAGPAAPRKAEEFGDVEVSVTSRRLWGADVDLYRVDRSQLINGKTLLVDDLNPDGAFFVGLNSAGHIYLVANVHRYDGKFAFEEPGYRKSGDLERGLVLRVEDPGGRIQDAIAVLLRDKGAPRAVDCAVGVCKLVFDSAAVKLAEGLKQVLFPEELIQHLAVDGARAADGSKLKVQVFMLGNGEPEAVIKAAQKVTERTTKGLVKKAVRIGAWVGGGAVVVSTLLAGWLLF